MNDWVEVIIGERGGEEERGVFHLRRYRHQRAPKLATCEGKIFKGRRNLPLAKL